MNDLVSPVLLEMKSSLKSCDKSLSSSINHHGDKKRYNYLTLVGRIIDVTDKYVTKSQSLLKRTLKA